MICCLCDADFYRDGPLTFTYDIFHTHWTELIELEAFYIILETNCINQH